MEELNYMIINDSMREVVKEISMLREEIRILGEREKLLKNQVGKILGDKEFVCNEDGVEVLTYRKQLQTRLDSERIKKEWPDLYEEYSKTVEVRTLLIK